MEPDTPASVGDAPAISVIVLAWRLTEPLVACVAAVRAQRGAPVTEVIVVVNGPDPDVRAAAARSGADRVVESPVNLGFGGGVGLGVAEAHGSSLVFLNDDATPQPGWLAALAGRAAADPSIGAVASLLVEADGTLQEAGSRVLRGGGTRQWGRGLSRQEAEAEGLLTARDIDYGSAAALLVRREAFEAVDGFDPRYEPAYYEDVDLQLRLRSAGWRVVLEPTAVVVHVSGGSTVGAGSVYREFLGERSGARFIDRWREVLEQIDDDAPLDVLAPVELGVGERRVDEGPVDEGAGAGEDALGADVVRPDVQAAFTAWLIARKRRLLARTAEAEAESAALQQRLDALEAEHRALQQEHHDTAQTAHALRLRVDDLESHPFRSAARGLRRRS
jgi:GT2 family glycosyltransferase